MERMNYRIRGVQLWETVYTREEIKKFWTIHGEGHGLAERRKGGCVTYRCSEDEAIFFSAMWIRNICNRPHCLHYDGDTLSIYCGFVSGKSIKQAMDVTIKMIHDVNEGVFKCKIPLPLFSEQTHEEHTIYG